MSNVMIVHTDSKILTNFELQVQQDVQPITSLGPSPDKDWTYVDAELHEHRYVDGADHYPTLVRVIDETRWETIGYYGDGDGDGDEETGEVVTRWHYICPQCAEVIIPRQHPPGHTTYVTGLIDARVTLTGFVDDCHQREVVVHLLHEGQLRALQGPAGREWAESLFLDPPEHAHVTSEQQIGRC